MILSVITFYNLKNKYVVDSNGSPIGTVPEKMAESNHFLKKPFSLKIFISLIVYAALAIGLLYIHGQRIFDISYLLLVALIAILIIIFSDKALTKLEIRRIVVIFVVSFFVVFFWSAFEQAGASLSFFAAEQTNLHVDSLNFNVPPSWFQSLNSFFVVAFAPVFAWIWIKLGKRNLEPNSPTKMAIGLLLLAIGYLWIAYGVKGIQPGIKVSMIWLTGMYALHSWGELCLSPIGLSLVNQLAPLRFASLLMAVWFMANAAANVLAGKISALYPPGIAEVRQAAAAGIDLQKILNNKAAASSGEIMKLQQLKISYEFKSFMGFQLNNLYDFFMLFVIMAGAAALLLFMLTRWLHKMMHEANIE